MTGARFIAAVHVAEKLVSIVMQGVESRGDRDVRYQSIADAAVEDFNDR